MKLKDIRKVAYIFEGIVLLLLSTVPFQLSLNAYKKNAYGLMIILMFFALIAGLCGTYLLKESGRSNITDW
jgi:hypothetical protein